VLIIDYMCLQYMTAWVARWLFHSLNRLLLRLFWPLRCKIGGFLYKPILLPIGEIDHIRRLDRYTSVKHSHGKEISEAATMRYVAAHTTVPVPAIIDSWLDREGREIIVMSYVPGEDLRFLWPRLDEQQRDDILAQLANYIAQLRALPPPYPGYIGPVVQGGKVYDTRIALEPIGPFKSVAEFNDFISIGLFESEIRQTPPEILERMRPRLNMHRSRLDDSCPTVFSHADFAARNIRAELSGRRAKVTGIIDWEHAGWYPEWWEFVKAQCALDSGIGNDWLVCVRKIMVPYETELRYDAEIQETMGVSM
jgi:hypothetical protein